MRISISEILGLCFFCLVLTGCSSTKSTVDSPDFSTYKEKALVKKSTKKKHKKEKTSSLVLNTHWQENLLAMVGDFGFIEDSIELAETTTLAECPVLVLKDKSRLLVRVVELLEDTVKVETCDDGAFLLKFDKSDLKGIYYDSTKLEQIVWREEFASSDTTAIEGEAYYVDEYQYDDASEFLLEKARKQAIWSSVFGFLSLFFVPFGVPALILGIKSLKTFRRLPHPNNRKSAAIAGVVLGSISTALLALILLIIVLGLILGG